MTAQYAFFIAREMEWLGSRKIDLGLLLSRALVHDMDEAVMVDLPRPIKYADPVLKERWTALCVDTIHELERLVGVPFYKEWLTAKDDKLEGQILALADLISVTSYVIEEIKFGNSYMLDVLRGNIRYLQEFCAKNLANVLKDLAADAIWLAETYLPETSHATHRRPDRPYTTPARDDVRLLARVPDGCPDPHVG
jgi:5'-deoxynucleotidase YfbR-like HD superfamily hydrolase